MINKRKEICSEGFSEHFTQAFFIIVAHRAEGRNNYARYLNKNKTFYHFSLSVN